VISTWFTRVAIVSFFCLLYLLAVDEARAETAFLKHSYVSGLYRVCIYTSSGGDVATTVRATDICPLTIEV